MQVIVDNFLDSLKSIHTKEQYKGHIQRYKEFKTSVKFTSETNPKLLTENIKLYLMQMEER